MYARFWCRLHVIDDTAGKEATLISLCALFLHLLQVKHLLTPVYTDLNTDLHQPVCLPICALHNVLQLLEHD